MPRGRFGLGELSSSSVRGGEVDLLDDATDAILPGEFGQSGFLSKIPVHSGKRQCPYVIDN